MNIQLIGDIKNVIGESLLLEMITVWGLRVETVFLFISAVHAMEQYINQPENARVYF